MTPEALAAEARKSTSTAYGVLTYAVMIWGANVSMIKLLAADLPALPLSALRMLLALLCIWGICLLRGQRIGRVGWRDAGWLLGAGALMVYAHQVFLAQGVATSSATNGALILGLNPIFSVLLGYFLLGERQTWRSLIGIILGLAGAAIVVLHGGALHLGASGDTALFAALFTYVAAGVCIRRVSATVPPLLLGFYMHLFGAVLLVLHAGIDQPAVLQRLSGLDGNFWWLVGISALFSTALGNLSWAYGIATIGLSRSSVFLNWLPISGVLFAVLFLHEPLGIWRIAGLVCVVLGTYVALKPKRAAPAELG
ncbi:MAG: DMT family transporter [Pseudomonas sp.]|uniref:DMT family transporter n=1 Tax=Pseudomonas sp. TaxID=306 RepID=UPI00299D6E04|nr:DMT family transporter [Pseudomonas sp.]MDX1726110.1 DMT family transporter [Pseudomonas sp.]